MADFALNQASEVENWSANYLLEYVRKSGLSQFMGSKDGSIIRVKNELMSTPGAIIHFPLVAALSGEGVTDGATLEGNEEALDNYSDSVRTRVRRNAVNVKRNDAYKTMLDIANAAKNALKVWSANKLRDDLLKEFCAVVVKGADNEDSSAGEDSTKTYAAATATERNAFVTLNSDRVLFGAAKANNTGTMSTSLDAIDATTDKMSAGTVMLARSMARTATNTAITPYMTEDGREFYVLFVDSNGFRDLAADADIKEANLHARERNLDNPLFKDGDLWYRGVLIREIPELTLVGKIADAGAAGTVDVGTAFLAGQDAVSLAYSQKPTPRINDKDYSFQHGVGIEEIRGQKKTSFAGKQYGGVTIYHASVDAA